MGKNGSCAGEDHQPRVRTLRQGHGRRQQALRLQLEHAGNHAKQGPILPVQGHGEHDARIPCSPMDQLGHPGLAVQQGLLQGIADRRLKVGHLLEPAVLQVHPHLAIAARHQHGIEKLHCGQPLLQQPLQGGGQVQHVGCNPGGHRPQHLLALLDFAGQQPGEHLYLIVLLVHQPSHGLLARGPGEQPARHAP